MTTAAAFSSISAAVSPVMATQTLPMRERRNWGTTVVTFILMVTIAVSYRAAGKDANFPLFQRAFTPLVVAMVILSGPEFSANPVWMPAGVYALQV